MAGCLRDPVAAETFFAQLPPNGLRCDELHLLEAFQQLANATKALQLPRGVSLQEWADRRVPDSEIDAVNASGLVYVAPRYQSGTDNSAPSQDGSWPSRKSGPAYSSSLPASTRFPGSQAEAPPKKNIISRFFSGIWGVVAGRGREERDPYDIGAQNDFYYDEVQRRWRQRGADDAQSDTSGIDPFTGRPLLPSVANPQALAPPPMGSASSTSGAYHLNRSGPAVGSLYVVEGQNSQTQLANQKEVQEPSVVGTQSQLLDNSAQPLHTGLQSVPIPIGANMHPQPEGVLQTPPVVGGMQPVIQPLTGISPAQLGGPGEGGPLSAPYANRGAA